MCGVTGSDELGHKPRRHHLGVQITGALESGIDSGSGSGEWGAVTAHISYCVHFRYADERRFSETDHIQPFKLQRWLTGPKPKSMAIKPGTQDGRRCVFPDLHVVYTLGTLVNNFQARLLLRDAK